MKRLVCTTVLILIMLITTEIPILIFSASGWWRICDIIALLLGIRFYMIYKEDWLILACASILIYSFCMIYVLPITLPIIIIIYAQHKYAELQSRTAEKKGEREVLQRLDKLGAKYQPHYLTWEKLDGVGNLRCVDCGYEKKNVVAFIHGINTCSCGRQCPKCGSLLQESFYSDTFSSHGTKDIFKCASCGNIIRKANESDSSNRRAPLFCPNCKSVNLEFFPIYLT